LIGQKHPGMQGQDPKVGFADVWPMFDKIIKDGRETGEPHIGERQMLLFQRNGFVEETYYSWKFMPLVGEEGYVVASYVTVFELTREMIGDRRLASLQYMGRHMAAAKDLPGFWRCLLEAMEPNDKDMPLVMLYAKGKYSSGSSSSPVDSDEYILEGLLGIPEGHASAPSRCKLGADSRGIAAVFEKALNAPGPLLLKADDDTLPSGMFDGLTWRGFGVPSEEFLVNTIRTVNGTLVGIMFLGLNPMKKLDLDYQDHIHLVTAQIASPHVSAILLTEELRQGEEDTKVAAFQRAELSIQLLQRTKEFERSEDRFARFATLANVGVAAADTSGHLIYANPAFYEINGISPTSTEPMPLLAGAIPEDAHLIHKAWAKTLAGQPSQTFQIRMMKPYVSYSEKYGHIESEHMTGLCAVYPELDEQGNLSAATALIMDISELKWTEEQVRLRSRELEESEIKYKNFADHAPIGVGLINSESHMEYMNEAWQVH
jgi:PAS domain-containing protein